ncbi:MAG: hypothetical protein IRZ08_20275, partial [Frankia sp.]|nr:hypothetical protein [Frankia sp.]
MSDFGKGGLETGSGEPEADTTDGATVPPPSEQAGQAEGSPVSHAEQTAPEQPDPAPTPATEDNGSRNSQTSDDVVADGDLAVPNPDSSPAAPDGPDPADAAPAPQCAASEAAEPDPEPATQPHLVVEPEPEAAPQEDQPAPAVVSLVKADPPASDPEPDSEAADQAEADGGPEDPDGTLSLPAPVVGPVPDTRPLPGADGTDQPSPAAEEQLAAAAATATEAPLTAGAGHADPAGAVIGDINYQTARLLIPIEEAGALPRPGFAAWLRTLRVRRFASSPSGRTVIALAAAVLVLVAGAGALLAFTPGGSDSRAEPVALAPLRPTATVHPTTASLPPAVATDLPLPPPVNQALSTVGPTVPLAPSPTYARLPKPTTAPPPASTSARPTGPQAP